MARLSWPGYLHTEINVSLYESSVFVGCGGGVVCSGRDSSMAYCDRCDFEHSIHRCSSYLRPVKSPSNDTADCVQGPVTVYTGNQLRFTGSQHYPLIASQRYKTKQDVSSAICAVGIRA